MRPCVGFLAFLSLGFLAACGPPENQSVINSSCAETYSLRYKDALVEASAAENTNAGSMPAWQAQGMDSPEAYAKMIANAWTEKARSLDKCK